MPIAETDLILYGAANRPENDEDPSGGAITLVHRPVFTQMAADDNLEVVSSDAGDTTQEFTVLLRNPAGALVTKVVTLNGTTPVAIPDGPYERVLRASINADAVGTVTLRRTTGPTTVGTIPPGERGFFAMFIDSASEETAVNRYEKTFYRNNHASLTLNNAKVQLEADPAGKIEIGLAASKDDTGSVANRKTAPGGVTFVDDGVDQDVPDGTLEAESAIGVWIKQALGAGDAPVRSTFTLRLAGTSV